MARKHPVLFPLIALLIPLVVLLLLEFGLRMAGFGKAVPLFIQNPVQPDYLLPRPDIMQRYFPEGQAPRVTMEANFFLAEKPKQGLRLVVQGGSTAAGFPYGMGAAPAGMLEHRLRRTFSDRHVEVINTAMSAVNSYLFVDLADEIIAQQPDGILIYAGHNEYLGIFGAGSSFAFGGPWLTRAYFAVTSLALTDVLQRLLGGLPNEAVTGSRTFMSQIAKDTRIALDSERYQQGLAQFEGNLTRLLDKYEDAGIPVFLSTIASNIKDQPPFLSSPESGDAARLYREGKALAAAQSADARAYLEQARDADLLRFRAPSAINRIIRRLASRPGVTLVDAHQALVARSPQGLIGQTMMLEHLHPTLPGYFIIADAFYAELVSHYATAPANVINTAKAWQQRLITEAEEYYGYAQVQALKADFPFTDAPRQVYLAEPANWAQQLGHDYFNKRISWLAMMRALHQGFTDRQNDKLSFKTQLILADALPHSPLENVKAGDRCYRRGLHADALYYYQRAARTGAVSSEVSRRIRLLNTRLRDEIS